MTLSTADIETIVRRVLSTLTANDLPSAISPKRLKIADRVVSVSTLRDQLAGIEVIEVDSRAVITPAVRDLCREKNVTIVHGESKSCASSKTPLTAVSVESVPSLNPKLLVAGSAPWLGSLAKQLCPKQTRVSDVALDDASAIRSVSDALRGPQKAGVAIVNAPHAACWQAARDERLRPAVVSQWRELEEVLSQVPVNVLILSATSWNVPSASNLVRRFHNFLQSQS
jgi:hypothetical protein